ncbi:phage protein NinX family protein [Neptunomonas japonica]|uniref:DUF2591 domain-containing protein n=1 Tax=Neptunomonas japonica JAMM 1380 TaxID=1441457 RepID=A0A7R6PMW9_9GAMM|nr:phage protein NinX family protein [Neptunomonas japonica]BBB29337.1 conserved hypothetical protein [Neptunomonas japonica JAMM 1380]
MSYEDVSTFEINKAVAVTLGYLVKTEYEEGRSGFTEKYHEQYPNTIWAAKTDERGQQCEAWEQMNFCANPEEAWPVIIVNNIIITPRPKSHIGKPRAESWGPEAYSSVCDDNSGLLRAAMIVFLQMMQLKR